jgi:hypothetical protein
MALWVCNPGLKFNEHIEADGPTVFAHACKMGARRHRVEAQGLALPLGALAALAQNEKPGARGGEAGGGGGLGEMTVQRVKESHPIGSRQYLGFKPERVPGRED